MTTDTPDLTPLQIAMVSDPVCPWCWLGLRRLITAGEMANVALDVRFRPFQLDPTVPREGVGYADYMRAKFARPEDGGPSKWDEMRSYLEAAGEAEGIPFDFSGLKIRPNTLNAHRLIRWAQGQDLGVAAKEALFKAYFTDHADIGDTEVLSGLGKEIGLEPDVLRTLFARGADEDAVEQEEAQYRQAGVSGVPVFIAHGRYAMQGAQETELLAKFLTDMAQHADA